MNGMHHALLLLPTVCALACHNQDNVSITMARDHDKEDRSYRVPTESDPQGQIDFPPAARSGHSSHICNGRGNKRFHSKPQSSTKMQLVLLSDTHCQHHNLGELPHGDVLVHAGDFCSNGGIDEALGFISWFAKQPHRHKILVAGNHDTIFDQDHAHAREYARYGKVDFRKQLVENKVHYLENEEVVIENVKFYGSPYVQVAHQPSLWAFSIRSQGHARSIWSRIPSDVDVLVTHSPPFRILDFDLNKRNIGCPVLFDEVVERVRPKLHVFGHCHTPGNLTTPHTTFINASSPSRSVDGQIETFKRILVNNNKDKEDTNTTACKCRICFASICPTSEL